MTEQTDKCSITQPNYKYLAVADFWTISEATDYLTMNYFKEVVWDSRESALKELEGVKRLLLDLIKKSVISKTMSVKKVYIDEASAELGEYDLALSRVTPTELVTWAHTRGIAIPCDFNVLVSDARGKSENDQSPEKKLRPNQIAKARCQAIAEYLWDQEPEIKIKEMVARDEIKKYGHGAHYLPSTIYDWVTEVAPKNRI